MASVYNSKIGTLNKGAALTAENNPTGNGFVGLWEDVKDYMTVISTISQTGDQLVQLYFQWSAGSSGEPNTDTANVAVSPPSDSPDILAFDQFFITPLSTYQVPVRARWFRLVCQKLDGANTFEVLISTVYKHTPTDIKITSSDVIAQEQVNNSTLTIIDNSTPTMLTDSQGSGLGTTGKTGSALYITLTDQVGTSLATNEYKEGQHIMAIALKDSTGTNFASTKGTHNSLAVHPSNSTGISQGSTQINNAAPVPGVSMHYALADCSGQIIDTTAYAASRNVTNDSTDLNAMYVCLSVPQRVNGDITGYNLVSKQTPMFAYIKDLHGLVTSFDTNIGHTSLANPVYIAQSYRDANNLLVKINLNTVGFVNESSVPVWLRLYDINIAGITALKDSIRGGLDWNDVPNKEKKLQNRLSGYDNDGNNYDAANDKLSMNVAVLPEDSRDLKLRKPIKFVDGIHVSGSANYLYTSVDPIADNHVYMNGTWAPFA